MGLLWYRIPGEEVVKSLGYFHELPKEITDYEGFVITNFLGSKRYGFANFETQNNKFHFAVDPINVIDKSYYLWSAQKLIHEMKEANVSKTVYSRIKSVDFDESKTTALFDELVLAYPNAMVYLLSDPKLGTWIGASPELLLRTVGDHGFSIALAGTKVCEDGTKWLEKEQNEQALVSEYISEKLSELQLSSIESIGPYDFIAGPVKHLRTDFSFNFSQTESEILEVLHPTPAVCGEPKELALEIIEHIEQHDRSIYTGYLGLLKPNDSKIYVNLRCCQIRPGKMYLYLGGGFTEASDAEMEWKETENKSKTILDLAQKL